MNRKDLQKLIDKKGIVYGKCQFPLSSKEVWNKIELGENTIIENGRLYVGIIMADDNLLPLASYPLRDIKLTDPTKPVTTDKPRKLIYVCSKYSGDVETNVANTIEYCKCVCKHGYVPVAPHIYFTRFLDNSKPEERKDGMELGLQWLKHCNELWIFDDEPSIGMQQEIEFARANNIPTAYVREERFWTIEY